MRLSNSFFITRKEYPKDEDIISTKLLVKSGMIHKYDNGIYGYLPMGLKVVNNIKKIIREEMNEINAEEVLMPSFINTEIFEMTDRNNLLDDELFTILSRNNKSYSLCPTHEELFALLSRIKIKSYKDLHFSLFQITNKYRDEIKCEYGLNRKKEFLMADAYSFDADEGGLEISYDKMFQVFKHTFNRIGLSTQIARSDPESMKGIDSEEFHVICDYGDNEIVKCTKCSYSTNIEYATSYDKYKKEDIQIEKKQKIYTPNIKTIKELTDYLDVDASNIIKAIIIKVDEIYKMLLLRGDAEVNFKKIEKMYPNRCISLPTVEELEKMGTHPGFVGPLKTTMEVIADNEVKSMYNAICGSNEVDYHYKNINPGIDFKVNRYANIKLFNNSSLCPKCKSECEILKGIEVGHIFKLGSSYSQVYNLRYLDEKNELNYVHMGSYGIGIDRCISSIVEKHHDDKGIIWPIEVAPYKVGIVVVNVNDKEAYKYAKLLYDKLNKLGIDTILDDRKETVGIKFNDMDLIGVPIRITLGRKIEQNIVEIKERKDDSSREIETIKLMEEIFKILNK